MVYGLESEIFPDIRHLMKITGWTFVGKLMGTSLSVLLNASRHKKHQYLLMVGILNGF